MTIVRSTKNTTLELKLSGWLDTETSPMLEEQINMPDDSITSLILDCTDLEYISSAGLRQIVSAHKKMNGAMTLRNVSDEVMSIIKMSGLTKKLHIEA